MLLANAQGTSDKDEDEHISHSLALEAGLPTGTGQWGARPQQQDAGKEEERRVAHQRAQAEAIQRLKQAKAKGQQRVVVQHQENQGERQTEEQQQQEQVMVQQQEQQQQGQVMVQQQSDHDEHQHAEEHGWKGLEDSCVLMGTVTRKVGTKECGPLNIALSVGNMQYA